jgi:hypothetical protein
MNHNRKMGPDKILIRSRLTLGCKKSWHGCSLERVVTIIVVVMCTLVTSSCATAGPPYSSIVGRLDRVLLVPSNDVSSVGWCIVVVGSNNAVKESGCPTGPSGPLIIYEGWGEGGSPLVAQGYAVTSAGVSAVSVDGGPVIRTHQEPMMPDKLRTVVVELRGLKGGIDMRRHFMALDAKWDPIRNARPVAPLGADIQVLPLSIAGHSADCRIKTIPLARLVTRGGNVASRITPYRDLLGHPYLTCVVMSYEFEGWPAKASILVDASQPGVTPRPLPYQRETAGHPGIFRAPGIDGEMVAYRVPGGWLTVVGGRNLKARLIMLEHLRALVHF